MDHDDQKKRTASSLGSTRDGKLFRTDLRLGIATMKMNFIHIHHDIFSPARSGKYRKLGGMTGFPRFQKSAGKPCDLDMFHTHPGSNPGSKHRTPIPLQAHLQ